MWRLSTYLLVSAALILRPYLSLSLPFSVIPFFHLTLSSQRYFNFVSTRMCASICSTKICSSGRNSAKERWRESNDFLHHLTAATKSMRREECVAVEYALHRTVEVSANGTGGRNPLIVRIVPLQMFHFRTIWRSSVSLCFISIRDSIRGWRERENDTLKCWKLLQSSALA